MAIDIDAILAEKGVKTQEPAEETPVVENEVVEETPEVVENEQVAESKQVEENEPVVEEKEEPVSDTFPSDKFDGKYNDWDEIKNVLQEYNELKNKEPENPFKDDFIKKVVDVYNEKGDLTDFFKAHSVDWNAMQPEEVLKSKFKEKYKDLDPKHINRLWEKEKEKYNLDSDDDEDSELGKALMERDANEVRAEMIKNQESYLQTSKAEPEKPKYTPEQIKESIKQIPAVNELLKNKKLTYKVGDDDFNLEVKDTEFIMDALADDRVLINTFIKEDGNHDIEGYIDTVNFAKNREAVRQAWIDYGKTLGTEKVIEEDYKNSTFKKQPSSNDNEALSFIEGLGKAFATKGKLSKF